MVRPTHCCPRGPHRASAGFNPPRSGACLGGRRSTRHISELRPQNHSEWSRPGRNSRRQKARQKQAPAAAARSRTVASAKLLRIFPANRRAAFCVTSSSLPGVCKLFIATKPRSQGAKRFSSGLARDQLGLAGLARASGPPGMKAAGYLNASHFPWPLPPGAVAAWPPHRLPIEHCQTQTKAAHIPRGCERILKIFRAAANWPIQPRPGRGTNANRNDPPMLLSPLPTTDQTIKLAGDRQKRFVECGCRGRQRRDARQGTGDVC